MRQTRHSLPARCVLIAGGQIAKALPPMRRRLCQRDEDHPVEIISRDPDITIHIGVDGQVSGHQGFNPDVAEAQARRIAERPGWNSVKAVGDGGWMRWLCSAHIVMFIQPTGSFPP
ncbi:hypothetical protein D2T29_03545 [Sinirhodobacter populi]|uniref:Uncharacterized protein n=1 Tax=Paenirhodobacter populi TaxID=2306993 RepID=A0A443KP45_9RHOB|nr:hypothetical protein [Sinirhodobacter populi]RWR34631.1 hypothetical protein D2T29_03545 [Sinirhodobacter populi]